MTDDAQRRRVVLVAEDDPDDRELARDAWKQNELGNDLRFVKDGQELMEYLTRTGAYSNGHGALAPRPDLVILDLNMPRKDGYAALAEMRAVADLKRIPVVVLTTSQAPEDVARCYETGANSFITKPSSYQELVDTFRTLGRYWLATVRLPDS